MTKAEAKIQIQKIKETIADKKYRYGIFNDGLKRQIEHEKKSKSIQKDPSRLEALLAVAQGWGEY